MKKADFFIVGAPKSGTTSLYEYLRTHPDICFSDSKEPHFFSFDFEGYCTTSSLEEYHRKEFGHCSNSSRLWGEASVWYLYSEVAIQEIKKYNPHAKIIVLLRDPVDMMYSLHSQMRYNLDEDIEDFETAWGLQEKRAAMEAIPEKCRVPAFLQYRKVGSYGHQINRVLQVFDSLQVKIVLFEDLAETPREAYLDILSFLGLNDDGREDFQVSNQNKDIIFRPLAVFIERPPAILVFIANSLKKITGKHRLGIYPVLNRLNEKFNARKIKREKINPGFDALIRNELKGDIERLEQLIERDLSAWKNKKVVD